MPERKIHRWPNRPGIWMGLYNFMGGIDDVDWLPSRAKWEGEILVQYPQLMVDEWPYLNQMDHPAKKWCRTVSRQQLKTAKKWLLENERPFRLVEN